LRRQAVEQQVQMRLRFQMIASIIGAMTMRQA